MSSAYLIVLLLHAYIGVRLVPHLPYGIPSIALLLAWLAASALLMPLGMRARRAGAGGAQAVVWAGLIAMGSFSSLFVLTVLRDIVLLAARLAHFDVPGLREQSALAVPLLAALFTLIGFVNARRRAAVRRVDVPIAGLPTALAGFTIAQISDLHVGPTIRRRHVEAVVDAVNALEPDVIAITGDLVDGAVAHLAPHTEPLGRLAARHGAYFVTGNHEYYSGVASWVREIRRLGVKVLLNEHVVLRCRDAAIVIAGVTDYGAHHFNAAHRSDPAAALAGAPPSPAVRIVLAHQPRSAAAAAQAGFDLQLSGHTHGGQFLPWNFFVRFQQPFTAGLHKLGRMWDYVSRGTGYWGPPKRFGAPSEITRIRLVPAPA